MGSRCSFDERQLWVRGDIFKHGLLTMGGLLIVDAFLRDSGIKWAGGMYSNMLILMITVMTVSVEMICRGAYLTPGYQKWRQILLLFLMGGLTALSLIFTGIELAAGKNTIIAHGQLTDDGFCIATSVCMLVIYTVFAIRKLRASRQDTEDN